MWRAVRPSESRRCGYPDPGIAALTIHPVRSRRRTRFERSMTSQSSCRDCRTSRTDCELLADGVDISTIPLMLAHARTKQGQRYLKITNEELRKAMTEVWNAGLSCAPSIRPAEREFGKGKRGRPPGVEPATSA